MEEEFNIQCNLFIFQPKRLRCLSMPQPPSPSTTPVEPIVIPKRKYTSFGRRSIACSKFHPTEILGLGENGAEGVQGKFDCLEQ